MPPGDDPEVPGPSPGRPLGFWLEKGGDVEATGLHIESLHKACGSIEVAKDLLGRSHMLYTDSAKEPDRDVMERFVHAATALTRVVEALQEHLVPSGKSSLGPAA